MGNLFEESQDWQTTETEVIQKDGILALVVDRDEDAAFFVIDSENSGLVASGVDDDLDSAKDRASAALQYALEE